MQCSYCLEKITEEPLSVVREVFGEDKPREFFYCGEECLELDKEILDRQLNQFN